MGRGVGGTQAATGNPHVPNRADGASAADGAAVQYTTRCPGARRDRPQTRSRRPLRLETGHRGGARGGESCAPTQPLRGGGAGSLDAVARQHCECGPRVRAAGQHHIGAHSSDWHHFGVESVAASGQIPQVGKLGPRVGAWCAARQVDKVADDGAGWVCWNGVVVGRWGVGMCYCVCAHCG